MLRSAYSSRSVAGLPLLVAAVVSLGTVSCASELANEGEQVDAVSSAVSAPVVAFYDGTGDISIRIKTCNWANSGPILGSTDRFACAYCSVDQDWARVGGGAEVENQVNNGGRLKASFPSQFEFATANSNNCQGEAGPTGFNTTWVARSTASINHRLRAYVVEMRIRNAAGKWSAPDTTMAIDRVEGYIPFPSETVTDCMANDIFPSSNYAFVAGGAEIVSDYDPNMAHPDAFLTQSRPITLGGVQGWRAGARFAVDQVSPALKCYGIGINTSPAQFNGTKIKTRWREVLLATGSGYRTVASSTAQPWVATTVGGWAEAGDRSGRPLADLIPFNGTASGFTVRSMDGGAGAPTHGYSIDVSK